MNEKIGQREALVVGIGGVLQKVFMKLYMSEYPHFKDFIPLLHLVPKK